MSDPAPWEEYERVWSLWYQTDTEDHWRCWQWGSSRNRLLRAMWLQMLGMSLSLETCRRFSCWNRNSRVRCCYRLPWWAQPQRVGLHLHSEKEVLQGFLCNFPLIHEERKPGQAPQLRPSRTWWTVPKSSGKGTRWVSQDLDKTPRLVSDGNSNGNSKTELLITHKLASYYYYMSACSIIVTEEVANASQMKSLVHQK